MISLQLVTVAKTNKEVAIWRNKNHKDQVNEIKVESTALPSTVLVITLKTFKYPFSLSVATTSHLSNQYHLQLIPTLRVLIDEKLYYIYAWYKSMVYSEFFGILGSNHWSWIPDRYLFTRFHTNTAVQHQWFAQLGVTASIIIKNNNSKCCNQPNQKCPKQWIQYIFNLYNYCPYHLYVVWHKLNNVIFTALCPLNKEGQKQWDDQNTNIFMIDCHADIFFSSSLLKTGIFQQNIKNGSGLKKTK